MQLPHFWADFGKIRYRKYLCDAVQQMWVSWKWF